jgi:hypothetical protein
VNDWLVSVPGPVRFQETPLPEESFVTTAVMVIDLPWSVCVEEADIATEIGGAEVEQEDANATASNATRLAKATADPSRLRFRFRWRCLHRLRFSAGRWP